MAISELETRKLERLIFFSDAIFAIAITLLVIEVHVPHLEVVTENGLANALLNLIPQYIGFLVSFFVIGRFWMGHHRAFALLDRSDDTLMWRNLLFLMTIAFMPFPTALVSSYASSRVAVGVYASWLILAGLLNRSVIRYLTAGPLLSPDVPAAEGQLARRSSWSPVAVGGLALAGSFLHPLAAMVPLLASPIIVRLFARRWRTA